MLGLLLASGDAVFASLFSIDLDLGGVAGHVGGVLASALVFGAILLRSRTPGPVRATGLARPIGPTEAGVVLGAIAALYGVYVVTQLIVLAGGAQHVLETADLTRAEYARAGFFQLLWAAGLTLLVLLGLRSITVRADGPVRTRLTALSLSVVLLTLGLVVSSLVRLALYNDAFGLTMLRLSSMVFAGWVGLVLVLVGADFVASGLRGWLPVAVAGSALLVLATVNAGNPEAFVGPPQPHHHDTRRSRPRVPGHALDRRHSRVRLLRRPLPGGPDSGVSTGARPVDLVGHLVPLGRRPAPRPTRVPDRPLASNAGPDPRLLASDRFPRTGVIHPTTVRT